MITPSIPSGAGRPGGVLAARPYEAPEDRAASAGEDFGTLFALWLQQGVTGRGPDTGDGSSLERLPAFDRTVAFDRTAASEPGRRTQIRADDARAGGRTMGQNGPPPDPLRDRSLRTQPATDRQEFSPHTQSLWGRGYGTERGSGADTRAGSTVASPRNTPGETHDRISGWSEGHRKDSAGTRPETPDRQRDVPLMDEAAGPEAARDAEGRPLVQTGSAVAEPAGAKIQQEGLRIVEGQNLPATPAEAAPTAWAQRSFQAGESPDLNGTAITAPAPVVTADADGLAAGDPQDLAESRLQGVHGAGQGSSVAAVDSGSGALGLAAAGSAASPELSGQTPGGSTDADFLLTADPAADASLAEAGMDAAAASEPGKTQGRPWIQVTASLTEEAGSFATPDGLPGETFAASAGNLEDAAPGESGSGDSQDLPALEEETVAARRVTETVRTDSMRLSSPGDRTAGVRGDASTLEAPAASGGMGFAGRYAAGLGPVPVSAGGSPAGSGFGGRGSGAEAQGRQQSPGDAQTRPGSAVAGQPAASDETDGGFATQIDTQTAMQSATRTGSSGSRPAGFAVEAAESVGNHRTAGDGMAAGVEAARPGVRMANGTSGVRLDPARAAREPGLDIEPARSNASATPARTVRVDLPGDAGGESLRLRFLQRGLGNASAIDVRIQGASEQGVREIRSEIPALLERLGSAGFRTAAPAETGSAQSDGHGATREGTHARHGAWNGPGQGESGSGHGQGDEHAASRHHPSGPDDVGTTRSRRSAFDFEEALRTLGGAVPSYGADPRGHQEG